MPKKAFWNCTELKRRVKTKHSEHRHWYPSGKGLAKADCLVPPLQLSCTFWVNKQVILATLSPETGGDYFQKWLRKSLPSHMRFPGGRCHFSHPGLASCLLWTIEYSRRGFGQVPCVSPKGSSSFYFHELKAQLPHKEAQVILLERPHRGKSSSPQLTASTDHQTHEWGHLGFSSPREQPHKWI